MPVNTAAAARLRAHGFFAAANRAIQHSASRYPREHARDTPISRRRPLRANGIDICYEIFGNDNAEPLLLIMGLGAQMIHWDDEFCEQLAARGFRVIRFDNRDIGKSSHLTGGKRLTPLELLKLRFLRIPVAATYKLIDMAKDTVGLMDALGIKSAHLVGASMGGMIAQEVTLSFPRARALADLDHVDDRQSARAAADTRGRRHADGAAAAQQGGVHRPLRRDLEGACAPAPSRRKKRSIPGAPNAYFARGLNPAGVGRQLRAVLASGSRKERLHGVKTPTLVIHGTVDPLVRPEGGKDTAASIPGAKLLMIEGMGHALPMRFWPRDHRRHRQARPWRGGAGGVDRRPRSPCGDHVSCRLLS